MDVATPLQYESVALLKTVNLAEGFRKGRAVFRTDCLPLKQATDANSVDHAHLGCLLREIKYQL